MLFDYETLKLIWWVLIGVLLIGFAVTDGFDMGVGALIPLLGKTDEERRIIINTVGPHWDGNQVWFITAGGALFAAWPVVYGVAFSGFYWAMLLTLFALFFRPVGFEYRSKIADKRWRSFWDWGLFAGGFVPALVFGVAFGNLFLGVPFELDTYMRSTYTGGLLGLLNPFALLSGVLSVAMLMMHGAVYLQLRTDGAVAQRARSAAQIAAVVTLAAFSVAGLWLAFKDVGYVITSMGDPNLASVPTAKVVTSQAGAWFHNYQVYPWMIAGPVMGLSGAALVFIFSRMLRPGFAFLCSSVSVAGIICTAGWSLFPFILPSSLNPSHSLTVWDVTSSLMTMNIMFWAAMIFVPLILCYTLWGYVKMWGKVTAKQIQDNPVGNY
jgi:cytochrome bd ubiquinol oxidase subunit II